MIRCPCSTSAGWATSPPAASGSRSSAGDKVSELILHRGPLSAEIGLLSVLISWLVGLPVGILSALRPNSLPDNVARSIAILFLAIPGFWLGMLIVLAALFWFGYKAPLVVVHLWQDPWANLQLVIGPAIVLGLGQGAYIARMSRSCLLEVVREDYVRTARAKGSGRRSSSCVTRCPNALLPVVTLSGILMGFVLGGSVAVEQAFGVPGLGRALVVGGRSSATSSSCRTSCCSTRPSSSSSTSRST